MNAFRPAAPAATCSSICASVVPCTTPPQSAKSTTACSGASSRLRAKVAPSSVGGRFWGISTTVVTPPRRAPGRRREPLLLVGVGPEQRGVVLGEVGVAVHRAREDDQPGGVDRLAGRFDGAGGA